MNTKLLLRGALVGLLVMAEWSTCRGQGKADELFSFEKGLFAGMELQYRKAEVGDSASIVVLYLHGGSGQGDDNRSQMASPAIMDIYEFLEGEGMSFTMLVPQAPYGQQWMGSAVPALKGLLDEYSDEGAKPVYVLGGSMGGNGTWNLLTEYPGYVTGAMPVACDPPREQPATYTSTRILTVAGDDDRKRNLGKIRDFFGRLTRQGGDARADIERGWSHRRTCDKSFSQERLGWLFAR